MGLPTRRYNSTQIYRLRRETCYATYVKNLKVYPPPNHYKALPTYLLFLCLLVIGTLGSSGPNPTNLRQ